MEGRRDHIFLDVRNVKTELAE